MTLTPSPSHAAHVWAGPNGLVLALPPPPGYDKGQILHIPETPAGFAALCKILKNRAMGQPSDKLGTRSVPIQYLVDAMAKVGGVPAAQSTFAKTEDLFDALFPEAGP